MLLVIIEAPPVDSSASGSMAHFVVSSHDGERRISRMQPLACCYEVAVNQGLAT